MDLGQKTQYYELFMIMFECLLNLKRISGVKYCFVMFYVEGITFVNRVRSR